MLLSFASDTASSASIVSTRSNTRLAVTYDYVEMAEIVEATLAELSSASRKTVRVIDFPDFCMVASDFASGLGRLEGNAIDPAIAEKFALFRGSLPMSTAIAAVLRIQDHVRQLKLFHGQARRRRRVPLHSAQLKISTPASEWRPNLLARRQKEQLSTVVALIDTIIVRLGKAARSAGMPEDARLSIVNAMAVLETQLAVLNGPLIEIGIAELAANELAKIGNGNYGLDGCAGLRAASREAARMWRNLLHHLASGG